MTYADKYSHLWHTSYMKLSQYAKQQGISYRTAFRWWQAGQIQGYQAPSGTIIVTEGETPSPLSEKIAIYARVSSQEHRDDLERQVERLQLYCRAKGYQVAIVAKEVASGVNESRPKLLSLLKDTSITRIVVEHKDRLTRFGANYILTFVALHCNRAPAWHRLRTSGSFRSSSGADAVPLHTACPF